MARHEEGAPAVFITGASYGVGAATALAFARAGYDIAMSATRVGNLDHTVASVEAEGRKAVPLVLDLNSQESIEDAMATVIDRLGGLSVLVNNAGAHRRVSAIDITREDWDHVFRPNLDGTFFLTQQFGRHMIASGRAGSIINITSTHSIIGSADRSMYGVSKAALNHLTRMLAIEWAEYDIRVNAIAPGRMMTEAPSRAESAGDPSYIENMLKKIPLHRMAAAEDVAGAALFLASPDAGSITGHTLVIDGGLTVA